mgnify:CR=1 FL=1
MAKAPPKTPGKPQLPAPTAGKKGKKSGPKRPKAPYTPGPTTETGGLTDYATALAPRSVDQLWIDSWTQSASEAQSEIAPLKSQIGILGDREDQTMKELGDLFNLITGAAQDSASALRDQQALDVNTQRALFDAAKMRITNIGKQSASDAQALSQMTGIEVPVADPTTPMMAAVGAAGDQAQMAQMAQDNAAINDAEAFAGQVLPLLRLDAISRAQRFYDDKVVSLQDEIAAIKKGVMGDANAKFNEALASERQYALELTQRNRDWWAARKAAEVAAQNAETARTQAANDYTLGQQNLELQGDELKLRERELKDKWRGDKKNSRLELTATAGRFLQALLSPGQDNIKVTQVVEIDTPGDVLNPPADTYRSGGKWYKVVNTNQVISAGNPITDPQEQYNFLLQNGIPRNVATQVIRQQSSVADDWKPGQVETAPTYGGPPAGPGANAGGPTGSRPLGEAHITQPKRADFLMQLTEGAYNGPVPSTNEAFLELAQRLMTIYRPDGTFTYNGVTYVSRAG